MFIPFKTAQYSTGIIVLSKFISPAVGQEVLQFTYQSQSITFSEWISLLTLCLAPLIAHIIAGVPAPTYLSLRRPSWHNYLGHFNPTSILWRYFVITDRRARSKGWTSIDMAANCALFWTNQGWDGSEEMILRSRAFCTRLPSLKRISFLSVSAATTLIVTIQGIQSVYAPLAPLAGLSESDFAFSLSFSTVSFGLAFLGLMRLPAAMWLTDDFSYRNVESAASWRGQGVDSDGLPMGMEMETVTTEPGPASPILTRGLLHINGSSDELVSAEEMFHSTNSYRGVLIRILFCFPLCCVTAILIVSAFYSPYSGVIFFTGTHLSLIVLYSSLILGVIAIFSFHFWTGQTRSTVLPCVDRLWFKIYTAYLLMLFVVAMVVSGLETRRSKCGIYTSTRKDYDQFGCRGVDW